MCVCVCLCVCLSVCSLFLMHGYSFEWICTQIGAWHLYTLHMVMGLVSAARARGLALNVPKLAGVMDRAP